MKNLFLLFLSVVLLSGCASSKYTTDTDQFTHTIQNVDQLFNDSAFAHAHWGALIKSLDTDEVWYNRNSNKVFMPASNQKILTTAAAIINLGEEFRFTTNFNLTGELRDTVMYGDLVIKGNGDPTLYTRFYESPLQVFEMIIDSLKNIGIKRIEGDIIGDDNTFDDQHLGNGWSYDYLDSWYAAPVGALQLNENYIDLKITPSKNIGEFATIEPNIPTRYVKIINELVTADTGSNYVRYNRPFGSNEITIWGRIKDDSDEIELSPSITNPTAFYTAVFSEALINNGIELSGVAVDCDEIENWEYDSSNVFKTFTHTSPPLREIVKVLMKVSQNLYAETMLRVLASESGETGTFRKGREVIKETYEKIGIKEDDYNYADGSGLTRYNFISPNQLVKILEHMYDSEYKDLWLDILPLAGVDGTLRRRMKGTSAEGNVRAKTGTISNVRGLSGYVQTADGENLVFSFLVNGHLLTARDTERITDSVLEFIADFKRD